MKVFQSECDRIGGDSLGNRAVVFKGWQAQRCQWGCLESGSNPRRSKRSTFLRAETLLPRRASPFSAKTRTGGPESRRTRHPELRCRQVANPPPGRHRGSVKRGSDDDGSRSVITPNGKALGARAQARIDAAVDVLADKACGPIAEEKKRSTDVRGGKVTVVAVRIVDDVAGLK